MVFAMFEAVWTFLKDPANQALLTWIGGGIVVIAGGIWAVVKFFAKKEDGADRKPSVKAKGRSVAIGGDNKDSPISIGTRGRSKR
jgi:hypothetical protein